MILILVFYLLCVDKEVKTEITESTMESVSQESVLKCQDIMLTCPCYEDPLYSKIGVYRGIHYFLFLL